MNNFNFFRLISIFVPLPDLQFNLESKHNKVNSRIQLRSAALLIHLSSYIEIASSRQWQWEKTEKQQ